MNFVLTAAISFFAGVFASLGLGGGMVLIIFLTWFKKIPQLTAQGINLIFFLPIAALSLCMHAKNNLVEWKKIWLPAAVGAISAVIFSLIANKMDTSLLEKLFAVFLIISGIKEFFSKNTNSN